MDKFLLCFSSQFKADFPTTRRKDSRSNKWKVGEHAAQRSSVPAPLAVPVGCFCFCLLFSFCLKQTSTTTKACATFWQYPNIIQSLQHIISSSVLSCLISPASPCVFPRDMIYGEMFNCKIESSEQ